MMCWYAVKKLLTHSLTHRLLLVVIAILSEALLMLQKLLLVVLETVLSLEWTLEIKAVKLKVVKTDSGLIYYQVT